MTTGVLLNTEEIKATSRHKTPRNQIGERMPPNTLSK